MTQLYYLYYHVASILTRGGKSLWSLEATFLYYYTGMHPGWKLAHEYWFRTPAGDFGLEEDLASSMVFYMGAAHLPRLIGTRVILLDALSLPWQ